VVSDEVVLDLGNVPTGVYRLAVGMYEANSTDRAEIVTEAGEIVPGGRLILEDRIELQK
jgi:hypothetical protein